MSFMSKCDVMVTTIVLGISIFRHKISLVFPAPHMTRDRKERRLEKIQLRGPEGKGRLQDLRGAGGH